MSHERHALFTAVLSMRHTCMHDGEHEHESRASCTLHGSLVHAPHLHACMVSRSRNQALTNMQGEHEASRAPPRSLVRAPHLAPQHRHAVWRKHTRARATSSGHQFMHRPCAKPACMGSMRMSHKRRVHHGCNYRMCAPPSNPQSVGSRAAAQSSVTTAVRSTLNRARAFPHPSSHKGQPT